jgi:hypothetical protein
MGNAFNIGIPGEIPNREKIVYFSYKEKNK